MPTWFAGGLLLALVVNLRAQDQTGRLIDGEPYDVIVLNDQNQDKVLQVLPLDLPDRKLPTAPSSTDSLRVRLVSNPSEELEVSWSGIARVDLFEQMVLTEARRLTQDGKFDDAFEYLTYVHNRYPSAAGLREAVDHLLYTEASSLYQQGKLERALLLLDELYQRAPTRRAVIGAIERVLERTFDNAMREREFQQARRLYELAQDKYVTSLPALLERWQRRLEGVGAQALTRMREDVEAGRLREAYMMGRRLMEIWPATPEAAELLQTVAQRYPLLRVGVEQIVTVDPSAARHVPWSWSGRRTERLRVRRLFDRVGVGPDGNEYRCNVGEADVDEGNRSLAIQTASQPNHPVTGVHLAQLFLATGDPESPWYNVAWASLVDRVGASALNRVDVSFRRPHLRPVALLDVPLGALGDAAVLRAFEPYLVGDAATALTHSTESRATVAVSASAPAPAGRSASGDTAPPADANEQRYLLNSRYFAATVTQPREVVEQRFETPQRAIQALRDGQIDLIDRVFPADVAQLRREERWNVTAYRIPTVHVLIPNHNRPHTGNRLFRRGLVYALDREKILRRDLLAGTEVAGCQVISGPFSPGVAADDPMAYGYDARIQPRTYDPRHAKTMLQLAQLELMAAAKEKSSAAADGSPPPALDSLLLVHPDHEIARVACAEVAEDLKVVGLNCTLRTLPAGTVRPDDNEWDLLYVDYSVSEPLVDAEPLLAFDGLVGSSSPHLNLALRQLARVDNWNDAGERLRVIHQLCYDDTTLIPLWQIVEHLVHRKGIEGIAAQPMTPYQNIENWRINAAVEP